MFSGLRHDAFVCSDHEQRGVNSPDAGQHIFDKVAVTGHVHDSHFFAVWECHPTEAKLYGHLAGLFLLETIRVDPRKRGNEGRLAVVYVTCCSNHTHRSSKAVRGLALRAKLEGSNPSQGCITSLSSLSLSHDP